jgi:hypothetical protein
MAKNSGSTKRVSSSAAAESRKNITVQNSKSIEEQIKSAEEKLKAEYGGAYDKAGTEEQISYLLKDKTLSEGAKDSLKKKLSEYKENVTLINTTIKSLTKDFPHKHFGTTEGGYDAFKIGKEYVSIKGDTITRGIGVGEKSSSASKIKNSITGKMSVNHYQGADMSNSYSFKITDKVKLAKLISDITSKKK